MQSFVSLCQKRSHNINFVGSYLSGYRNLKKNGGASAPPSTYLSTAMKYAGYRVRVHIISVLHVHIVTAAEALQLHVHVYTP